MADDYFPGASEDAGSTLEGPPGPPKSKPESDEEAGESALIPKSMLGGDVQPGQTITVKVKRVYDEEVEVEPVGQGGDEEADESSPMDAAMGEMDRMGKAA